MTGTLAGALEARGILTKENLVTDVEGDIIKEGDLLLIDSIRLKYRFKIPQDKKSQAERALALHQEHCEIHRTLKRGIDVSWTAEIVED